MIIRKATRDDIQAVADTYTELLEHEQNTVSYTNWKMGLYPTRLTAENTVANDTLYVLEDDGAVCASMILNHIQPCEHEKITWKYEANDEETLTVHTLCVPPSKAGKGYGKAMMKFACDFARETGCKVVRLDTYIGNLPAQAMYRKLGFDCAGTAYVFFEGLHKELMYFEYKLDKE